MQIAIKNLPKSHHIPQKGGACQEIHNNNNEKEALKDLDPTLWNTPLGRRKFLKKAGLASAGTTIALNGLVFEVLASGSGEKRGTILIWRLTKAPGESGPLTGQWKNNKQAAAQDFLTNGVGPATGTHEGYTKSGKVIGTVIEAENRLLTPEPPGSKVDLEEQHPGNPNTKWRWVIRQQCFVAWSYAKRHKGPYEYKTSSGNGSIPENQVPPNVIPESTEPEDE